MPKLPPFGSSRDKTPKYTVKEVAEMMELSTYTVRYYENAGLVPEVDRSEGNIRLFSDYSLGWLRLVHCLRATGLPIEGVRRYIELCAKGDASIPERAEIIFAQEKSLRQKHFYEELLAGRGTDRCNPANPAKVEPDIVPQN